MESQQPVIIVGGGAAGIMAARVLKEGGVHNVMVVEKSRSVGGRLATRRLQEGKVDHGAQFFTARTKRLQQAAAEWQQDGVVKAWFGEPYTRYTSVNGMNTLIKYLAQGIDVKLNARVTSIAETSNGLTLTIDNAEQLQARGVIFTAPAPQTKELLQYTNSNVIEKLEEIAFAPCLVGLFTLHADTRLPQSGHAAEGLPLEVERIVDHKKKGISESTTVSVYMKGDWSQEHYDWQDDDALREITKLCAEWFDAGSIQEAQLKRWRYAEAQSHINEPFLDTELATPAFVAGDAFLHPDDTAGRTRFESAFLSGIAAGEEMLRRLSQ